MHVGPPVVVQIPYRSQPRPQAVAARTLCFRRLVALYARFSSTPQDLSRSLLTWKVASAAPRSVSYLEDDWSLYKSYSAPVRQGGSYPVGLVLLSLHSA